MNKRTWNDQPAAIELIPIRMSFFANNMIIELRSDGERHYVTTGNLFGSQTLVCESIFAALAAVDLAAHAKKEGVRLPDGCEIYDKETN